MSALPGLDGVIRMPPVSLAALEVLAVAFLGEVAPACLKEPERLNVAHLVDEVLPRHKIHVSPANDTELGDAEGITNPDGSGDIEILIQSEQFAALTHAGPSSHRGRATTCHEIGHAVLHVPVIRRRRSLPHGSHLLKRVSTHAIKPYENPEWQAWAFAGCILMPRCTIKQLVKRTPADLSRTYGVSEAFAAAHLKRLRIAG